MVAEVAPGFTAPGFEGGEAPEAPETPEEAQDDWAGIEAGPPAPVAVEDLPDRAWGLARGARTSSLTVWDGLGNSLSSGNAGDTLFSPIGPEDEAPPLEYGPPLPEPLDTFPRMPWAPRYVHVGTMDGLDATAIRIPVGPATRALTLDLKAGRADDPFAPRIDQVSLIGRGGEVLSHLYGVSFLGEGQGESQSLYLSIKGAPIGGEILVLLSSSQSWYSTPPPGQGTEEPLIGDGDADGAGAGDGPGDGAGAPPSWDDSYFELNIGRNEFEAPAAASSVETTTVGGVVYVASFGRVDLPISVVPPLAKSEATRIASPNDPAPRGSVAQAIPRREARVGPAEDGPVEVFLGPLVSRTAAAMGPILATAADEPTPSTDRAAPPRADVPPALASAAEPGARRPSGFPGEPVAEVEVPVVALRGPGGIPIVVAGLRSGDPTPEVEAVAASALGAAQEPAPPADPARPDEGEPEIARAGFAGRALGFLVGMGLASGPLYPDLLALARRKFRRVPRRAGGRRRVTSGRA